MGIEDRDWYREETAKKNGLRYNRKNATYSAAKGVVDSSQSNLHRRHRSPAVERMRARNRKQWQLIFFVLCAIASFGFAAFLLVRVLRL